MRNRILKVLTAWLLILCMFTPSGLAVHAADSIGAGEITVLEGAISQHFNDITTYRQEGALKAPSAPAEYEDYIFAGWYTDEKCNVAVSQQLVGTKITDENKAAYAKFVPKQVLSVNAQIPSGTEFSSETSNIRFVTTVDSLRYQEVGFDFVIKGVKLNAKTTKVYKRLYAMDDSGNKIKSYIPKHINSESEYFMGCVVTGVKNKDFGTGLNATPYWITLDGTKVSAESATKSVNMGYMSSIAEVSTKVVGEFAQPTTGWTYTNNPDYISAQGGCTDGTYYYQAVIHRDTTNIDSEVFDSDKNESIIQKYRWSDESDNWELDSTSTGVFKMANANDITYNSKLGLLVICHCGEPNAGKNRISFMDPETLTLVDPATININWATGVSIDSEGKYIDCGHAITAIDYNALRNQYVVNMSGYQKFKVLNADFSDTGIVSTPTNQTANYSKQAIGLDDSYVYYLFHQNNVIAVYDWDGNFVTLIDTDIDEAIETENISIYKNKIYIGCDDATNQKTVIYQVTGVQNFTSDSTVGADTFVLNDVAVTDFYAESTVVVSSVNTEDATYPRVGLRVTNTDGTNVDFVLNYDSSGLLYALVAVPDENGEGEKQQLYYIDSAINNASTTGIKLAVAKTGDTLAFYVNDVLQGTKTFDGFGADDAVTTKLYSKCTTSSFSGYRVITTNIEETLNTLHDTFVADSSDAKVRFDLLSEEDETSPKVTINENEYNGSIVNWNGVSASKFYAETTINLTGSNLSGGTAWAGMVLAEGSNRFYVLLYGSSTEITRLYCYSMDASDSNGYNNKTEVLKQTISLTDEKVTLALDRDGDTLQILLGGTSYSVDLSDSSKVPHAITGATAVGLTGWKAQATFTDYSFALTSDEAEGTKDVQVLNETASTAIYAETIVTVNEVTTDKWPRVGLRLKNTSGENVDFILTYSNDGATLLYAQVATTIDGSEVLQTYCIDSVIDSVSTDGVKMAVAKEGGVLYFYLNDVLLGIKTFDAFGADKAVTARLYSKNTTTYFSNYSVTTENVEIPMYDPADTFVADDNKSRIYFDILDEEDSTVAQVVTKESGNWASHSIVNWNNVSTNKFLAETTVELTYSRDSGSGAGIVLTSGDERFYVMLVGDASGITSLQCYSTTQEVFTMYDATTCTNGRVQEYSEKITSATSYKLTVYRVGNDLIICTNDQVQTAIDLSEIAYPITGTSQVGLTGWRINATFTDYSIKTGSKCPTMDETVKLVGNAPSEQVLESKTLEISDENEAYVDVKMKGASGDHDYIYMGDADTKAYAETFLDFTTSTAQDNRVGLVLKDSASNRYVAIYLHASYAGNVDKLEIATRTTYKPSTNAEKYTWASTKLISNVEKRKNVKLSLLRDGDDFVVYVDDVAQYHGKLSEISGQTMKAETKTYIGLHVMQQTATFYGFKFLTPKETSFLAANEVESKYVTRNLEISDTNNVTEKINIKAEKSSDHGYLYLNEFDTRAYMETTIDITGTASENRAGIALKNTGGDAIVGVYINTTATGNPEEIEIYNLENDQSNAEWKCTHITNIPELTRKGIKLAVLRDKENLKIYIDDNYLDTIDLSDNIAENEEAYLGLNVFQGSATFYDCNIITKQGETISLVDNANSSRDATRELILSDTDALNYNIAVNGNSGKHGYLYFNETSTKVYLETYVNITSSNDNNRAGITLKNADGDAMFGIFLRADGEYGAYRLEYLNMASHEPTGGDRWPSKLDDFSSSDKTKLKLSVLRNGDNLTICVNDIYKYTYTLSGCGSSIAADEAIRVGLITCQGSATFSDFTCSYGDNIPTLSE